MAHSVRNFVVMATGVNQK